MFNTCLILFEGMYFDGIYNNKSHRSLFNGIEKICSRSKIYLDTSKTVTPKLNDGN